MEFLLTYWKVPVEPVFLTPWLCSNQLWESFIAMMQLGQISNKSTNNNNQKIRNPYTKQKSKHEKNANFIQKENVRPDVLKE